MRPAREPRWRSPTAGAAATWSRSPAGRSRGRPPPGVPFDERAYVVPNAAGRVLSPDGRPLPGEYVAGWLKRGPTGVIGTNKSDAAETVRSLLEDLAGGPAAGDTPLPRPGLLRYPAAAAAGAEGAAAAAGAAAADAADWPLAAVLAGRGVRPVSYQEWLRIEAAEAELARALGRGERVKLADRRAIWAACRPGTPETPETPETRDARETRDAGEPGPPGDPREPRPRLARGNRPDARARTTARVPRGPDVSHRPRSGENGCHERQPDSQRPSRGTGSSRSRAAAAGRPPPGPRGELAAVQRAGARARRRRVGPAA